jgi:FixJ family two-component response regulator
MLKRAISQREEGKVVVASPAKPVVAVVDDDHRLLESLEDLLESAGYRVRLFASAGQFLDTAVAEVDCVITDIAMAGVDGFALQQIIRNLRPTLPVILITGHHEFATAEHEAVRGGRRLFEKPFDRQELLAAIDAELQGSSGKL